MTVVPISFLGILFLAEMVADEHKIMQIWLMVNCFPQHAGIKSSAFSKIHQVFEVYLPYGIFICKKKDI